MNVVAVAPHPDDEAIGCGGSIRLHAEAGDRVLAVFLTSGELGLKTLPAAEARAMREAEAEAAAALLGIAEVVFLRHDDWLLTDSVASVAAALAPILAREEPATVYLPHPGEWHPDHKAALPIVRQALDGRRPALRGYEVWTPLAEWSEVVDVSSVMDAKLEAIRCYRSQLEQFRYDDAARGLNEYRGTLAGGCRYAEAFSSPEPLPDADRRVRDRRATTSE